FSDRTSPSRMSRVRAPTYICHLAAPGRPVPPASAGGTGWASAAGLLPHLERLDDVSDPDVVVADADTALEALADLGRVVLEPAQGRHREVVGDDDTVADEPRLAVAHDRARADQATGDVADPRHPEDLADLGGAELDLLELRLQH